MKLLIIASSLALASAATAGPTGNDCSYKSNKVRYVLPKDITPEGPIYVGKAPLPDKLQGMFWLVDDGGDALISLGGPVGGDGKGECGNGKLINRCTTMSTIREGGWSFQAVAKAGLSGGPFPTPADKFYNSCAIKWQFCFDSDTNPTSFDAAPVKMYEWCVNVMASGTTTGQYKGTKNGGHYWRVTTKALGFIPLPDWVLGNFDMIQVMDGNGNKIEPAWGMFTAANPNGIVVYDDVHGAPPAYNITTVV